MIPELFSNGFAQPAECIIRIGGQEITDLYPYIAEVSVEATRNRFTEATIVFESPADETDAWLVADARALRTWSDIMIEADFHTHSEEIMRGVILSVNPSFPANMGEARVTVTCRDDSAKMDRQPRHRRWGAAPAGLDDLTILTQIASAHGLAPHPDSGSGLRGLVLLQNGTDADFLRWRAVANGYELIFSGGQIYFGPMRVDSASQAPIMLYAGQDTNCRSFEIQDDGHRRQAMSYASRDEHGNPGELAEIGPDLPLMGLEPAQGGGSGLDDHVGFLDLATVPDNAQVEAMALGRANEESMSVRVQGELDGTLYRHVLRVGEPVGVDGIGRRYSGVYYVDEVVHRFDWDGYSQGFRLMRNAHGDNLGTAAAGVLSSVL